MSLHRRTVGIQTTLKARGMLEKREMATHSIRRRRINNLQKTIVVIFVVLILGPLKPVHNLPALFPRWRKEAKIAFFIQVSSATVLHLPRLLKALHHPENVYAIHLDTKIAPQHVSLIKSLLSGNENYNNVIIVPSERISYAGVTMLLNTLNAIEILLEASLDWDFFINLSGADYPLVSPYALRKLLGAPPVLMGRLNMLQVQKASRNLPWFFKKRFGAIYLDPGLYPFSSSNASEVLSIEMANPLVTAKTNITSMVKTEGWVILHRSFSKYAVHSAQGRRLLVSYATVRASDEMFFGSLLESSQFKATTAWNAMRFISWSINGVSLARPAFLDEHDSDVREALVSSGALFARKFGKAESDLLDFIDANVSGISFDSDDNAVNNYYKRAKAKIGCIAEKRFSEYCIDKER